MYFQDITWFRSVNTQQKQKRNTKKNWWLEIHTYSGIVYQTYHFFYIS